MSPTTQSSAKPHDACLVIGGCGFLGYHLIARLLQDNEWERIYVLDRNVSVNLHDKVTYVQGELLDGQALRSLIEEAQPNVIFHAASPVATLPFKRLGEYARTNIEGTRKILAMATESDAVKALVYTSTIDVYANPPFANVTEDRALWPETKRSNEYNRTKAIGDRLVRAANCERLRTACVRLGHAYGERQSQGLAELLDACQGTQPLVQIGKGRNMMEVVSAANCALGHVAAAKALLREAAGQSEHRVGGEAFNISDGAPVPFWHHVRVGWGVVRGKEALEKVMILPAWIMILVVNIVEWVFWLFTLNTVRPPTILGRTSLEYCVYDHTFSIDKARERLGFRPVVDHDAIVARAVTYLLEERARSRKLS